MAIVADLAQLPSVEDLTQEEAKIWAMANGDDALEVKLEAIRDFIWKVKESGRRTVTYRRRNRLDALVKTWQIRLKLLSDEFFYVAIKEPDSPDMIPEELALVKIEHGQAILSLAEEARFDTSSLSRLKQIVDQEISHPS